MISGKGSFNLNSEVLIDKIKMMFADVDLKAIVDRAYGAMLPMMMKEGVKITASEAYGMPMEQKPMKTSSSWRRTRK